MEYESKEFKRRAAIAFIGLIEEPENEVFKRIVTSVVANDSPACRCMVEVFRNEAPSIIESIEKDIKRKSI
jgi:hypothetical protein